MSFTQTPTDPVDYIKNFNPDAESCPLTSFDPSDYTKSYFAFYWVNGGDRSVTATYLGAYGQGTVVGNFSVIRPTCTTIKATPNSSNDSNLAVGGQQAVIDQLAKNGFCSYYNLESNPKTVTFQYGDSRAGKPGIDFAATGLTNEAQGFNYTWLQVINRASPGNPGPDGSGRDNGYPYVSPNKTDPISATDSPPVTLSLADRQDGETFTRSFEATMWLLCTPTEGGIAVPYMAGTWQFTYTVKWGQMVPENPPVAHAWGLPTFYYHFVSATAPADVMRNAFEETTQMPDWSRTFKNKVR